MAKKYLSLEDAAQILGLQPDQLIRLREKGEIRGFADRGTWKFKTDDVNEFHRSRQPDSSPEVPLAGAPKSDEKNKDTDADTSVFDSEADAMGEQPTVIRGDSSSDGILAGTSDSDVRLILDDDLLGGEDPQQPGGSALSASDSEVRLTDASAGSRVDSGSDSDVKLMDGGSGVDVRLTPDSEMGLDGSSDSDVKLVGSDSDSDVRLTPDSNVPTVDASVSDVKLVGADPGQGSQPSGSDSDSDVKLVGADSDSDVKLVGTDSDSSDSGSTGSGDTGSSADSSDSDSDVKLVKADSDSDVKLVGSGRDSDSDVKLIADETEKINLPPDNASIFADDSDVSLGDDSNLTQASESGISLENMAKDDSGIALDSADSDTTLKDDSGVTLEDDGSGISLEASSDSGLTLESSDSGISLDADEDSGISISEAADSGISLNDEDSGTFALSDDSGIAVASPSDSGLALDGPGASAGSARPGGTIPMIGVPDAEEDVDETQMELPTADGAEGSGDGDTSVILFDDDDEDGDHVATLVKGKDKGSAALDSAAFDFDDSFADAGDFDDDDLEVAEDVLVDSDDFGSAVDDLDDLDIFDADDDDFEDTFESGESAGEFVVQTPIPGGGQVAAPVEVDWGVFTFVGLLMSTALLAVCGMVMIDLVRSMWGWQEPTTLNTALLDFLRDTFASTK